MVNSRPARGIRRGRALFPFLSKTLLNQQNIHPKKFFTNLLQVFTSFYKCKKFFCFIIDIRGCVQAAERGAACSPRRRPRGGMRERNTGFLPKARRYFKRKSC